MASILSADARTRDRVIVLCLTLTKRGCLALAWCPTSYWLSSFWTQAVLTRLPILKCFVGRIPYSSHRLGHLRYAGIHRRVCVHSRAQSKLSNRLSTSSLIVSGIRVKMLTLFPFLPQRSWSEQRDVHGQLPPWRLVYERKWAQNCKWFHPANSPILPLYHTRRTKIFIKDALFTCPKETNTYFSNVQTSVSYALVTNFWQLNKSENSGKLDKHFILLGPLRLRRFCK